MTEKSYLWDGLVTGDATLAPYNAQEFNTWMFSIFLSNNLTQGYVIPGYLDDLWVRGNLAQHAVTVGAGAACFNNYLYILDEPVTLAIERLSGNYYRRDLIVLRADLNKNQIRVAVKQGGYTASTRPAEPALTQTAAIYEIPLASVYVVGDATSIYTGYTDDKYVHDRRKFIYNLFEREGFQGGSSNLLRNSEWMAVPNLGVNNEPPAEWPLVGAVVTPGVNSVTTIGSGRSYGYGGMYFNTIEQWVDVKGQVFTVKVSLVDADSLMAMEVGLKGFRENGEESSLSNAHNIFLNEDMHEVIFTTKFPEDDIAKLNLYFKETDNANTVTSQVILQPGYHVGGYRQINEVVMFPLAPVDASWTATAKSTGTTTINLAASFASVIKNHTRAVILRLRGRDSGSAAAASCYLQAQGYAAPFNGIYGHLEISGVTNDVWRETTAIVPVDQIYWGTGVAGAQFRLNIVATGAATFDATVEVVGVIL